jgi:predicted nucleic acid-binding protein
MVRYVVDSWAWVEYLLGTPAGKKARRLIEGDAEVYTHFVSIGEIASRELRAGRDFATAVERVSSLSRFAALGRADAAAAGVIHAEVRRTSPNFSLADAFVLQLARKLGGKVVTGDPDFEGLEETEFLL